MPTMLANALALGARRTGRERPPLTIEPSTGDEGETLDLLLSGPELLGGMTAEVFVNGDSIGTGAISDVGENGEADVEYGTPPPGEHAVTVEVDGGDPVGPVTLAIAAATPSLTAPVAGDHTIGTDLSLTCTTGFPSNTTKVEYYKRVAGADMLLATATVSTGDTWPASYGTGSEAVAAGVGIFARRYWTSAAGTGTIDSPITTINFVAVTTSWGTVPGALAAWRADLGVTIATGVSSWVDQVGGTTLTEGTGANQPTRNATDANFNGQASVAFDGSNDRLVSNQAASFWNKLHNGTGVTVLCVCRPTGGSGTRVIYGTTTGATSRGHSLLHVPASDRFQARVSDGTSTVLSIAAGSGAPESAAAHAVLFTYETALTPDADLRYPIGTSVVTGSAAASASDAANTLRVGADPTPTNFAGVAIAELVIWPFVVSAGQRTSLAAHILARYGL